MFDALFGVFSNDLAIDLGTGDVAEINGESISQREFAIQYERAQERYRQMLKGSLTPEMIKALNIKGSLLEELIQRKLMLQEARRHRSVRNGRALFRLALPATKG